MRLTSNALLSCNNLNGRNPGWSLIIMWSRLVLGILRTATKKKVRTNWLIASCVYPHHQEINSSSRAPSATRCTWAGPRWGSTAWNTTAFSTTGWRSTPVVCAAWSFQTLTFSSTWKSTRRRENSWVLELPETETRRKVEHKWRTWKALWLRNQRYLVLVGTAKTFLNQISLQGTRDRFLCARMMRMLRMYSARSNVPQWSWRWEAFKMYIKNFLMKMSIPSLFWKPGMICLVSPQQSQMEVFLSFMICSSINWL